MKKTYNEDQLRTRANETFAQHPTAQKVFATTDGNVFLMENRARLHASSGGRVLSIDRPGDASEAEARTYPMNATKTAKAVSEAKTLKELEEFRGDDRKTVIAAVEKRQAELMEDEGNQGDPGDEQPEKKDSPDSLPSLGKDGASPENRNENTAK